MGLTEDQKKGRCCIRCNTFMPLGMIPRSLCSGCKLLDNDEGKVRHKCMLRCQHCKHQFNVYDTDYYDLFEEDEHDAICPECDGEFPVSTIVSYQFESPPIGGYEDE